MFYVKRTIKVAFRLLFDSNKQTNDSQRILRGLT